MTHAAVVAAVAVVSVCGSAVALFVVGWPTAAAKQLGGVDSASSSPSSIVQVVDFGFLQLLKECDEEEVAQAAAARTTEADDDDDAHRVSLAMGAGVGSLTT